MHEMLVPLIEANPDSKWLTVGDGSYGSDAYFLQSKGKKRGKGKGKIGGQSGHPKHERPSFPEGEVDRFHDYRLSACPTATTPM